MREPGAKRTWQAKGLLIGSIVILALSLTCSSLGAVLMQSRGWTQDLGLVLMLCGLFGALGGAEGLSEWFKTNKTPIKSVLHLSHKRLHSLRTLCILGLCLFAGVMSAAGLQSAMSDLAARKWTWFTCILLAVISGLWTVHLDRVVRTSSVGTADVMAIRILCFLIGGLFLACTITCGFVLLGSALDDHPGKYYGNTPLQYRWRIGGPMSLPAWGLVIIGIFTGLGVGVCFWKIAFAPKLLSAKRKKRTTTGGN